MQKNDKFYTFHLSHSFNSKDIYRQVRLSKRLVRGFVLGSFLVAGFSLLGVGLSGVLKNSNLSSLDQTGSILSQVSGQQPGSIDYSRPSEFRNFAINSGGPIAVDTVNGEDGEIEKQLLVIRHTADPANVPSVWAHIGRINNEFGFRRNPFGGRTYEFHPGMDIDGERGDLVIAPANGTVIKAGWQGGYGNMIEIDHGNGLTSRYGHLSRIDAEVGDPVVRGQLIAFVGSTGRSTGPHLHYEIRLFDKPINPRHFLPAEPAMLVKQIG